MLAQVPDFPRSDEHEPTRDRSIVGQKAVWVARSEGRRAWCIGNPRPSLRLERATRDAISSS